MLNLKHLYYYHIYAQELSTTKAAQRLGISPPALSNQLKELEGYLGFKLTHKIQGKVTTTEFGKMVAHYADRMFSTYEELKTKISTASDIVTNSFRVGISQYIGAQFSFDLLALIVKARLALAQKTYITFDSTGDLLDGCKENQIDLVIGSYETALKEEGTWIAQSLTFPVRLFAPLRLMEGLSSKERQILHSDLNLLIEHANNRKISFVLPMQPSVLRNETDHFFSTLKAPLAKTIECNNSTAIVQLIERGFAMGFVPTPSLLDFKSAESLSVLGPSDGYWSHKISIIAQKGIEGSLSKVSPLDKMFAPDPTDIHLT